ncbi:MAG: helix-turn-helix domain-containing protein [Moorellales bacterium]
MGVDRMPVVASVSVSLSKEILSAVLNCMVEVNRIILESGSFEMALERVLDTVRNVVGAEGAALLLYDEETRCLELQQPAFGFYDDRLAQLYRVSMAEDTIAVKVFQSGEPFISNNVPADPRFVQRVAPIVGARTNLSVPVTVGSKCIGVFHVINKPEGFSEKDAEVTTWLVSQLAVAIANARLLSRVRVQEQRARALYELAMELNLRDVRGLVRLVAQRLCAVLRCPLAAVALAEYGNDRKGRIAADVGFNGRLVGRIVSLGSAEEELKDLEREQLNPLEQEVARLGMVIQLSVPVPPGRGGLGRLWVWSDRKRLVHPSEREFVSLVAYLLGMAVQNASLYQQERETASRLDRYLRFQQQLVKLVLEGGGVQRITNAVGRFLGARVVFADHRLMKRAWAPVDSSQLQELDVSSLLRTSGQAVSKEAISRSTKPLSESGETGQAVVSTIEAGGRLLGYLLVVPPVARKTELAPVLSLVSPVYALEMLKELIASEVQQSLGEDFMGKLLSGKYSDEEALRRAENLGYDLRGPVVAIVVEQVPGGQESSGNISWRGILEKLRDTVQRLQERAVLTVEQGRLVAIVPCPGANQLGQLSRLRGFATLLREELSRLAGVDVYVGIGRVVHIVSKVRTSFRDACFVLEYLRKLSPQTRVLAFSELGICQILSYEGASDSIMEFVYELLGPVMEMDRNRGTEYLKTLDRYYAANCSLKGAADALYCHVNTVRYRLERIQSLLPFSLESVEHSLTLQTALRLLKFRHPDLF